MWEMGVPSCPSHSRLMVVSTHLRLQSCTGFKVTQGHLLGISQPFGGASCPLLFIFLHWSFRSPALGEKGPRAYILVSQRPAARWRSEDEYDRGIEIPLCPQNRECSVREQAHCMSGESGLPAGHFSSLNTPDAGLSQRRSCPGDPRSPPFFRLLGVGCVSALRQCRPCCVWRASEVAGAALVFSLRAGSPGSGPGRETPGL